jgi:hypothetical protein
MIHSWLLFASDGGVNVPLPSMLVDPVVPRLSYELISVDVSCERHVGARRMMGG